MPLTTALVVQGHVNEGIVNFQSAVVVNKAQLPELIHKLIDVRPRRAHHLRQGFVAYLRNTFRLAFFTVAREQQQNTRQASLAGVKKLIHQVRFVADVARQHIGDEKFGKIVVLVKSRDYHGLVNFQKCAVADRRRGHHAHGLPCYAPLTEETVFVKDSNNRGLPLVGCHRELYPAFLRVKDGRGRVSLHKDIALLAIFDDLRFRGKALQEAVDVKTREGAFLWKGTLRRVFRAFHGGWRHRHWTS